MPELPSIPGFNILEESGLNYLDLLRLRSLKRGVLYITNSVGSDLAERISLEIEEARNNGLLDLRVVITSPGGDVFAGLAIYDALNRFKLTGGRVTTEANGYAASMGAIILQAGDERLASSSARILIHEVSRFMFFQRETVSTADEEVKELKKVNDQIIKILADRSKQPIAKIKSLIKKKDYWMSAEEAKELNFVDKVI